MAPLISCLTMAEEPLNAAVNGVEGAPIVPMDILLRAFSHLIRIS